MKIISLPDPLYLYLIELIERHAAAGIRPEEGLAIFHLHDAVVNGVKNIDDLEISKAITANELQVPGEIVTDMATGKLIVVECKLCYDEEGSHACVRPAHLTEKKS